MEREYSDYGAIYVIYNDVNEKVYVGQTIRSLQYRIKRHTGEALKNVYPKNKFHRAIRKYGADKFHIKLIDVAKDQKSLDAKEVAWIKKYDSIENGYNTAAGGEGGNTYLGRSKRQMAITSRKLSIANRGARNGMSRQVKAKNISTGKEYHFETLGKCLEFLGVRNKGIVMDRANKKVSTYWRRVWMFAYEDESYGEYVEATPYDNSKRKGKIVTLTSQKSQLTFNSIAKASLFLNVPRVEDKKTYGCYHVTIGGPSRNKHS